MYGGSAGLDVRRGTAVRGVSARARVRVFFCFFVCFYIHMDTAVFVAKISCELRHGNMAFGCVYYYYYYFFYIVGMEVHFGNIGKMRVGPCFFFVFLCVVMYI
jgi:hypothetical protein